MIPPHKSKREKMDSRALAAVLSSIISQLILLLLHLYPSPNPLDSNSNSNSNSNVNIFPLLHHFLSFSEIAASLSLLPLSRKRKRTHLPDPDSPAADDGGAEPTSRLNRVNSAIPQNPDSFIQCFKMTSSTFEWLSALLEPLLECRDPINSPINLPAEIRLGIGLFRLATGSDYPEISRRFGVSEPISRFCVKQLCRVLCTNFRFWVGFPNPNELEEVSTAFETLTGLPNCCGIINCTRFKILRNKKNNVEEESIAAQIVVDSSSRILSIVAGFHGQKGNFQVLKSSTLYKDVESKKLLNSQPIDINSVAIRQYIVGDIGYPLLPWLVVPFLDPMPGSSEENFNAAYNLMHVSALKTIASLKNWGVLSRPIEAEFKTAVAYIGACSILHNCLLMRDDYSALCDELGDYSLHDPMSDYFRDVSLDKNLIESKGSEIRSALATRAIELGKSDYCKDPISSVQPQQN